MNEVFSKLRRLVGPAAAAAVMTLGSIAPAQASSDPNDFSGVLYIWVWILVVGIAALIIGTSLAGSGRSKR